MIGRIRDFMTDPRVRDIDINSGHRIEVHREILQSRKLMMEVFNEFYGTCRKLDEKYLIGDGYRVEIGSGSSQFKKYYPDIITTDIEKSPYIDRVMDAENMDFDDGSVRAIYGINCFHHFPQPERFLQELTRVLNPGGGCILIDPHHGPLSTLIHGAIHSQEHFNKKQPQWHADKQTAKSMSGANQALSYIVFIRDRKTFCQRFPALEIVCTMPLNNYLRYLLSGGLNFRQLIPDGMTPIIKAIERALSPLASTLALHHVIVLRKRSEQNKHSGNKPRQKRKQQQEKEPGSTQREHPC
jgi:SAM-dependent methyltransferase